MTVAVVGDSRFGSAFISQCIRQHTNRTPANQGLAERLVLLIVDGDESFNGAGNLERLGTADGLEVISFPGMRLGDVLAGDPDIIVVAARSDARTLELALELEDLRRCRESVPQVFVAAEDGPAVRSLCPNATVIAPSVLGAVASIASLSWQDRVAARLHRDYVERYGGDSSLTSAALNANRRPIRVFHRSLAGVGVRVAPASLSSAYRSLGLDEFEASIDSLAEAEHEDWYEWKQQPGSGRIRSDDLDSTQPASRYLRTWGELSREDREPSREIVRKLRLHLQAVGYELFPVEEEVSAISQKEALQLFAASKTDWFSARRPVHAVRLREAREWDTQQGDRLKGRAGDWLLADDRPGGQEWTVSDSAFTAAYRPAKDWYEKAMPVEASRVFQALRVDTPEGDVRVKPGDWLLRNEVGDVWPVGAEFFAEHYCPTGEDVP